MKIYENARIRVTLTDEQSAQWDHCRADILSHAMVILGNRSEKRLLEREPIDENEIKTLAAKNILYSALDDHCHYNVNDVIIRLDTGRIMSEGMMRDVEEAQERASKEFKENPGPALAKARGILERWQNNEIRYRENRGTSDWNIEIIGTMPEWIGLCRYQEEAA